MKHSVTASLASLAICSAGITHAAVCGPDTEADIPHLEAMKESFLTAEYLRFAEQAGPYFPDLAKNVKDYLGQVMVVFPNGFESCETVLQRREDPGFYQDVVFFYPAGSPAPVALLLVAVAAQGEVRLIEFTFNTAISDVLEDIK